MRIERTTIIRWLVTGAIFIVPAFAFAAGGGGGGGGAPTGTGNTVIETCTQDTWTCGDWGLCGLNGQQTRACTKSFDCPNADTPPAPPALRACTPECTSDTWACGQWGPCTGGRQRRICTKSSDCALAETPSPATEVACRLDCGNDVWGCTAWSACSSAGARMRTCTQRTDCETPDQPAPKPAERESCTPSKAVVPLAPKPVPISPPLSEGEREGVRVQTREVGDLSRPQLICGNLPTLAERVRCRIGLDEETLDREITIQYLPEECRAIPEGSRRRRCVDRYRNLRPCWAKPIGPERLTCVREVLGIRNFRSERQTCDAQSAVSDRRTDIDFSPRDQCMLLLREKVFPYITFRFYDLEERAEGLKDLGAPLDQVVQFVTTAEQAKRDFNAARTKDERIAIIRRVQFDWRTFVAALPEQVKTRARIEGVGSSY